MLKKKTQEYKKRRDAYGGKMGPLEKQWLEAAKLVRRSKKSFGKMLWSIQIIEIQMWHNSNTFPSSTKFSLYKL